MIRIEHPEYLLLLIGLAIVGAVYGWYFYWRKRALLQFGEHHLLRNILIDYSRMKSVIRFIITVVTFVLIVFGLINVQMGSSYKKVHHSGIDIALLMDVSNSMLATDAIPDRLDVARKTAEQLTDLFPDSRIAIISFAGSSSTLLPLNRIMQRRNGIGKSHHHLSCRTDFASGLKKHSGSARQIKSLPGDRDLQRWRGPRARCECCAPQAFQKEIIICTAAIGTEDGSKSPEMVP
jgi:hypothetical protein